MNPALFYVKVVSDPEVQSRLAFQSRVLAFAGIFNAGYIWICAHRGERHVDGPEQRICARQST